MALTTVPGSMINGAGNATVSGIQFPATQVPSADANCLDDYEEGTWTPAFGAANGFSFTQQLGKYTKIGNLVLAEAYVVITGSGNSTPVSFSGLPFTVKAGGYYPGTIDIGTGGVLGNYIRADESSTTLQVLYSNGGTTGTTTGNRLTLAANQIGAGYIIFSVTYQV